MVFATSTRQRAGVVVINCNLKDSLRETLASFHRVNEPDLTIVVSENVSTDGSPEMVHQPEHEVLMAKKQCLPAVG